MAVRIVSVSGGMCVTSTDKGILNKTQDRDIPGQFWTIEQADDEKIAIRNNAGGKYLRAKTGASYGPMELGEKQYWRTEPGVAPGSYWLKCVDFGDAYLASAGGSHADNNKIYMWPKTGQAVWTHALTWYIHPVGAAGYLSQKEQDGGDKAAVQKQLDEVKKREEAIGEKEKQLEDIKRREEAIKEKEKQLNDIRRREEAVQEREKQIADANRKQDASGSGASALAERERSLQERQQAIDKQQKTLDEQQQRLREREGLIAQKEKEARSAQQVNGNAGGASSNDQTTKELQQKNAQLAADLAEAQKQLREAQQGRGTGTSNGFGSGLNARPGLGRGLGRGPTAPTLGQGPVTSLPSGWTPHLMEKFKAGQQAMQRT